MMKVVKQDYHRNGSGGEGFVVSLIDNGAEDRYVSISFFEDDDGLSIERTATLNVPLLMQGIIEFDRGAGKRAEYFGPIVKEHWDNNPKPWERHV